MGEDRQTANPMYAVAQLERELARARVSSDASVSARAEARAERWAEVLRCMAGGELDVGSRTPVANAPAWATLEVLHGGFASGRLLAEGPLLAHESERVARLGLAENGETRTELNLSFLTDSGRHELAQMLESGRYRVGVPEEGALLVLSWLLERGAASEAEALLDAVAPMMARLRFYPLPHEVPLVASAPEGVEHL